VGFDVTDQLLIRSFAFSRCWRKNGSTMRVHQLFIDFKKAYVSVRREILYIILIEFGIPMKLVMLIKMSLNKTYSKVHTGTHLSHNLPIRNVLKKDMLYHHCFSPLL
jgi:hypothetical protein